MFIEITCTKNNEKMLYNTMNIQSVQKDMDNNGCILHCIVQNDRLTSRYRIEIEESYQYIKQKLLNN